MKTLSGLFACLALCFASAVQAGGDAKTLAAGLYEGTIGTLAIRVCFDDGYTTGTYYYLEHLKPIALRPDDKDTPGVLVEKLGFGDDPVAAWHIAENTGETVRGQWRNASRSLPIALERVPYTPAKYTGPCESVEFLAPRMAGGVISSAPATFDGIAYTSLAYVPGQQFNRETISIESFAIEPVREGDATINRELRKVLPDGSGTSEFMQCMGMMHLQWGTDGEFNHRVSPELVTGDWLGVRHDNSQYCGGAHPNYWLDRQVFDRRTGKEIDPANWLKNTSLIFFEFEAERSFAKRPVSGLSPPLMALVGKYWPGDNAECWSMSGDAFFGWDMGLAKKGIIFKPEVPHAITPCAESVIVPWSDLTDHLTTEGKAVRDSLR